jgi:hypothetical protein
LDNADCERRRGALASASRAHVCVGQCANDSEVALRRRVDWECNEAFKRIRALQRGVS